MAQNCTLFRWLDSTPFIAVEHPNIQNIYDVNWDISVVYDFCANTYYAKLIKTTVKS